MSKFKRTDKEYVFWLHYNQPESRKRRKPQITVHYRGICHIVNNIQIDTITFGYIKNKQPRWVIKGKTNMFYIDDNGTAHIRNSISDVSEKSNGYGFTFNYNKTESNLVGKPQITLIYHDKTYIVDNIECNVPIYTKAKRMHFIMNGRCENITFKNNIAYINYV